MLGHSKFVLITFGGWMIFKETITLNQGIGITVTLLGIILYTQIKVREIVIKKYIKIVVSSEVVNKMLFLKIYLQVKGMQTIRFKKIDLLKI